MCDLDRLKNERFHPLDKVFLTVIDIDAMGANKPLIKLYDAMGEDSKTDMPLFDNMSLFSSRGVQTGLKMIAALSPILCEIQQR